MKEGFGLVYCQAHIVNYSVLCSRFGPFIMSYQPHCDQQCESERIKNAEDV